MGVAQSIETSIVIQWVAVIVYVVATILAVVGVAFDDRRAKVGSWIAAAVGLTAHGAALVIRWVAAGHGPYMARHEVLSSDAWVVLAAFLVAAWLFPKVRPASIVVLPVTFLMVALANLQDPAIKRLPPTLSSIWLTLHISFYKIAFGTMVIALGASVLCLIKARARAPWTGGLPAVDASDALAYRFAGISFTFWAIGMLAGAIWAYFAWGAFWSWDPVETWSLLTWLLFGFYLHLRRFYGWKEERAAVLYLVCFLVAVGAVFFVGYIEASLHSQYFRS